MRRLNLVLCSHRLSHWNSGGFSLDACSLSDVKSTLIIIQKVDGALALHVVLNVTVRAVMCVSEAVAFSMHSHELLSAYLFRPSVCLSESLRLSLPCTHFCLLPCLLVQPVAQMMSHINRHARSSSRR